MTSFCLQWEETNDNSKTRKQCQQFLEEAHIAKNQYIESKNREKHQHGCDVWVVLLLQSEAQATKDKKELGEHIQQVTQHNATFMNMIHWQQKEIEELMTTSKSFIIKMTGIM